MRSALLSSSLYLQNANFCSQLIRPEKYHYQVCRLFFENRGFMLNPSVSGLITLCCYCYCSYYSTILWREKEEIYRNSINLAQFGLKTEITCHPDRFVNRRRNHPMRLSELPLFLHRSRPFFLDHRSTKLIIPERYDLSICSSWTFKPACPLKPVRRHSVLCGHSKQVGGVCLRPSSPMGKTISSSPKQSGGFSFCWVIGCWMLVSGCLILVTG